MLGCQTPFPLHCLHAPIAFSHSRHQICTWEMKISGGSYLESEETCCRTVWEFFHFNGTLVTTQPEVQFPPEAMRQATHIRICQKNKPLHPILHIRFHLQCGADQTQRKFNYLLVLNSLCRLFLFKMFPQRQSLFRWSCILIAFPSRCLCFIGFQPAARKSPPPTSPLWRLIQTGQAERRKVLLN